MPEPRSGRRRLPSRRAVLAAAAVGLSTALTASLSACSSSSGDVSSGQVTLTFSWWGNDDRADRTKKAVDLFEKEHPGVTVRTSNADFGSYMQKLATQAAGGGIPDVAQLDYRQISQYSGGGALLPLGDAVEDGTIRTSDMDEEFVATGEYEGKLYAVPMGRGITGYAYDSKIYQQAGIPAPRPDWTWDEWAEANRKIADLGLKSPDGRPVAGANDNGVNEDIFEDWLRSHGKKLYASQTELGFTEDDLTEFWEFCDKLREDGATAEAKDTSQANTTETSPMGRGLSAADYTWDAPFPGYTALLGDQVHYAPVPTIDGRQGAYFKPSMLLGVGANTEHPKEATELVDFLLNDERAGDVLGFTRSTPPNRKIAARVAKTLEGAEREIYEYALKMEEYGLDAPPSAPPKGDVALQTAFKRAYHRVMYELASPRDAAREFIDEAERELRS
ncbi:MULTISPECIES: ABC transporter substrate-binding protein [Streptomyces]|uniref:Extracellular solute-binding protein n=1 Tax=Streptomyces olivaceus TaxID=47716 RepID=A0ABS7W1F7_STROV|nr:MULTISPECIES: extracellular solute-binding protein [Streptomyces]MBZ6084504.1 extracellular solute-binding protein [Streptomyces olivaceus]MBZ6088418.1 extracellular solute-binding protein [Streptomyces olivaceus]MBZ6094745.1 extracellular solute-binding protein [Streptomyces olivaceus]MBZ6106526.1 extracellular solute-binding protein [Streptomyces olivaceus]MBZ6113242.1 extracellular solute-binding protein [Streptomyces olivaceus]